MQELGHCVRDSGGDESAHLKINFRVHAVEERSRARNDAQVDDQVLDAVRDRLALVEIDCYETCSARSVKRKRAVRTWKFKYTGLKRLDIVNC